ncbi:MAG: FtsX-like permease family protein [Deltaproteobacteria bacterium]|nr:FtsX-like permease family protein [Deltaproteobacteria bacterium]
MTPEFTARMAWRNIWRQKRRTFITAGTISLALLLALFTRSMQEGSYARNLDNATRFYSGYLQLQEPGFSENQSIDRLLPGGKAFVEKIHTIKGVTTAVPRLESFALGAAGERSKGVMVMGVAPLAEDAYSGLSKRVKKGRYFASKDEKAVLVGGKLAEYFKLSIGDEFVLYGQGFHGTMAAGLYEVAGIIHFPNQQIDARIVYLPLKTAQALYHTGNRVSAWVLHGKDVKGIPRLEKSARETMGPDVKVRNWADISPELAQQITMDRVSGIFMILVLYGVVGFGLFATIAMMTLERQREFAVMLATGMARARLQLLVVLESFFLALTGVLAGFSLAMPILLWFFYHPIRLTGDLAASIEEMGFEAVIPFSLAPELFVGQMLVVLTLLLLCSLYPLVRILKLEIPKALKGGL